MYCTAKHQLISSSSTLLLLLLLLVLLQALPDVVPLDQLTVNEYTPGVGLSAHIDTHSAFTGAILSLSLAGGCVMEFKKGCSSSSTNQAGEQGQQSCSAGADAATADAGEESAAGDDGNMQQVLVYLPPRSLVVMAGESRYAW